MAEVVVMLVSVPQVAPVQPVPLRDQVTPSLFTSFVTDAVRFTVPDGPKEVVVGGAMVTVMGGAAGMDSVTEVLEDVCAMEVAVMVTVKAVEGAVGEL